MYKVAEIVEVAELTKYTQIFLDMLRNLKLDKFPDFQGYFVQMRDALIKRIHESGVHKDSVETFRLCEEFEAKQMLIKVVYDKGTPDFVHLLNTKIDQWGHDFLLLSMRVVYFLEKRQLNEAINSESQYEGL